MERTLKISINRDICFRCGRCARVCPAKIYYQKQENEHIEIIDYSNCLACGHCAAGCPSKALTHSLFPPSKIIPANFEDLPTPEKMLFLCRYRRTNRSFINGKIPEEYLHKILEAARCAPTAGNNQGLEFVLLTDPEKIKFVSDYTMNTYTKLIKKSHQPIIGAFFRKKLPDAVLYEHLLKRMDRIYQSGGDPITYKASALLFITAQNDYDFATEDAHLAYQNASLMAECMGISQIYMGFVMHLIKTEKGKLEKHMGIDGRVKALAGLGMPMFRFPNYIVREMPIKLINK